MFAKGKKNKTQEVLKAVFLGPRAKGESLIQLSASVG
jgi:hypothetical protein